MTLSDIQEKTAVLTQFFLVFFAFFLPLSLSLKSFFLIGALILILVTPLYNKKVFSSFNTPWGWASVALFMFIVIACLWSKAPGAMQWMVVSKYLKVLYLPVLAVGFAHPKTRSWALNAYLAAIVITCIVSFLKARGFVHIGKTDDQGELFYNHIVTGFLVAFGSYLAALLAYRSQGWMRAVYLLVLCCSSYQILFINSGRMGYVLYFILMSFLLLRILSIKKALIGILLFCGLFVASYYQSAIMHNRVDNFIYEVRLFRQNIEDSSLGYRYQFHNYASRLFLTHPIIGIGTGGFKYSFARDNPVPNWGPELNEPHSQYWMTLCEQGLIGFLLLLLFLGSLFFSAFRLKETRGILLGILIAFSLSAFSDTVLCYSVVGYVLIWISALSLGEL